MSILKVANVHFEATGTNRIDYLGDDKVRITSANGTVLSGATNDALLRITQTGTGAAIRVEDSTNPDSTPFIVDANGNVGIAGNVGIGTGLTGDIPNTYLSKLFIYKGPNDGGATLYHTDGTNANVILIYGNGLESVIGTSECDIVFVTGYTNQRMRIQNTGNVLIGRTTSTVGNNVKLDVNGSINCSNIFVNGNVVSGGGTTIFTANLGNGSANTFNVAHDLNNLFVIPAVREYSSGYYVYPDVKTTTPNHIVIEFVNAPSTNQYAILVVG